MWREIKAAFVSTLRWMGRCMARSNNDRVTAAGEDRVLMCSDSLSIIACSVLPLLLWSNSGPSLLVSAATREHKAQTYA
jgi:hypothetical protein